MYTECISKSMCAAAILAISWVTYADEKPTYLKMKPPTIKLQSASTVSIGEAQFVSLTLEVSNPNRGVSLSVTGYAPDSFDPPIPEGQIFPLYQIHLLRKGQWKQDPIGFCGTGLTNLELAPDSPVTFSVAIPTGDWEAVKVGIGHNPGWSEKEETTTTTLWTVVFTKEEIEKRQKAGQPAKE